MLAQKTCWIPFASENRSAQETSSHHFSKRCSRIRNQICSLYGFYHVCNALTLNQINSYVYRIFLYENWLVVEEMIARTVRSFHLILRVFFFHNAPGWSTTSEWFTFPATLYAEDLDLADSRSLRCLAVCLDYLFIICLPHTTYATYAIPFYVYIHIYIYLAYFFPLPEKRGE